MADLDASEPTSSEDEVVCYRHRDRPTRLACSRCERPICGSCATPAVVGQHCPECVGEARRTAPRVRSTMMAIAPAVVVIFAANIVVYIIERASGFEFLLRWSMQPIAIATGEWWRLITATFLHDPTMLFHILVNMAALWIYGPLVEKAFGTARFVAMYLVAGFVGSATSYALGGCAVIGVGASGAIFGLLGILLVILHHRRRIEFVRQYFNAFALIAAANIFLGFVLSDAIDWRAHLGGLGAGLLMGLGSDSEQGRRPLAIQIASILAVAGAGVALVAYRTSNFGC
jgi:membrane associated rhomboid family serine protease